MAWRNCGKCPFMLIYYCRYLIRVSNPNAFDFSAVYDSKFKRTEIVKCAINATPMPNNLSVDYFTEHVVLFTSILGVELAIAIVIQLLQRYETLSICRLWIATVILDMPILHINT